MGKPREKQTLDLLDLPAKRENPLLPRDESRFVDEGSCPAFIE